MKKYYLIQDENGKFLQEGKWWDRDRMWSRELRESQSFETFEEAETFLNTAPDEEEWTANELFQDSDFYTIQAFYFRE